MNRTLLLTLALVVTACSREDGSRAGEPRERVRISGAIQGLKPNSEFGFHIHEKGDCSAPDASSAGAHFNPAQKPHGNPTAAEHHAGDMINLKSNPQGVGQVETTADAATIGSGEPTDVMGKAIVVHE